MLSNLPFSQLFLRIVKYIVKEKNINGTSKEKMLPKKRTKNVWYVFFRDTNKKNYYPLVFLLQSFFDKNL